MARHAHPIAHSLTRPPARRDSESTASPRRAARAAAAPAGAAAPVTTTGPAPRAAPPTRATAARPGLRTVPATSLRGVGRAASAAGLTAVLAAVGASAAGVGPWSALDDAGAVEPSAGPGPLPERQVAAERGSRDTARPPVTDLADLAGTSSDPAELLVARRAEEAAARAEAERLAREAAEAERVAAEQAAAEAAAEAERLAAEEAAAEAAAEAAVLAGYGVEPGGNRAVAVLMLDGFGWGGEQWECLDVLWQRESNWNHLAENPSSGAYGIPQSLPARKMAAFGDDYLTNPATQIAWGLDYIDDRYGTPCAAWSFWRANNWY